MLFTDSDYSQELSSFLDPQERLVWTGKPKGGFQLQWMDLFLIPFSIIWCGFSIFWMYMASQASLIFALFGIPFVLVGLYLVFGRFIIDKRKRDSTVYGLTAQRIIIKSGIFKVEVQSFHLSSLPDIDLIETSDGLGTITFGPKIPFMPQSQMMQSWPGMKGTPSLSQIKNARKVFNQIMQLKQGEK